MVVVTCAIEPESGPDESVHTMSVVRRVSFVSAEDRDM